MCESDDTLIELREWAGELRKSSLAYLGEVVGVHTVVAWTTPTAKTMYGILYSGRSEDVYTPTEVVLGPRFRDFIIRGAGHNLKEASLYFALNWREEDKELERYYNGVNSVAGELRGAYDAVDRRWDNPASSFVRMMLIDGLFVLELIDTVRRPDRHDNPVIKHMLAKEESKKRCLHDILLLQNQLPIHLLLTLRMIQRRCGGYAFPKSFDHQMEWCGIVSGIIETFCPSSNLTNHIQVNGSMIKYFDGALNILDVYRRCLVHHRFDKENRGSIWNTIATAFKPRNRNNLPTQIFIKYNIFEYVPPATKLHEAGIIFKISPSTSLLDIQFSNKTLILPNIEVDSYTKSLFLNLIAFEKLHKHVAKNEVTSYMYFMGCLVHGPEDVTLLQSQGIIVSRMPRAEVAAIFNRISEDISFDPDPDSELIKTVIIVRERYNKLSNEWRMELFQTYLKSPWAIISLVAAFLIFVLSILQTLYSILSYVHRN